MQSYVGNAYAKSNVSCKALTLSDVGRVLLNIRNSGPVAVCASYHSHNLAANVLGSADTRITSENVYDGDLIVNAPVAPGSLVLTSTGAPTLYDRDGDGILRVQRSLTTLLASGITAVTSIPGTRTITVAGVDFTAAGVLAGDTIILASSLTGACHDAGEYTIVTVGTTTLIVSTNFPVGSQTGCKYEVHPTDLDCGRVNYFTGRVDLNYPASPATASPILRGSALGSITTPVVLANGDTVTVRVDGAGAVTATFTAVAAQLSGGAGSMASSAGSNLVVKIDSGTEQTLTFTASELSVDTYVNRINTQLAGGYAQAGMFALTSMMGYLNDLKTQYNAHEISVVHHDNADSNLAAGNAVDLASAITLANSIRTSYRAHLTSASEVEEAITLINEIAADYELHRVFVDSHLAPDNTNVLNPALYPATDFTSACALGAEIKTCYNAHCSQAGVHVNNDGGDAVTAVTPATTVTLLKLLCNDIKAQYNAHCIVINEEAECVTLVNELYDDYEAHRASTTFHSIDDGVNVANPALYPATGVASAILLANDIRTCYLAHRSQAGVHINNDVGNNIASGACVGLDTMVTLLNQAKVALNGHLVAASELEECCTLLNEMQTDYEAHRIDVTSHNGADAVNTVAAVPIANSRATANTLANALAVAYTAHRSQLGVHVNNDGGDAIVAVYPPTNHAELKALCNDLKAKYNAHLAAASRLEETCTLVNELRVDYEAHRVVTPGVHGAADNTNVVNGGLAAASDVATAAALLDEIYTRYEAHRILVGGGEHGAVDDINVADVALFPCPVTEIGVALAANDLKAKYNAHHILALGGVHAGADPGNTVAAPNAGTAGIHKVDDTTNPVASANVGTAGIHLEDDTTDTVTSPNAGSAGIHALPDNTHLTTAVNVGTAAIHLTDDVTNDITSGAVAPGDLSGLQTLVAELYVKYPAHLANTGSWHKATDVTNVTTVVPHLIHLFSSTQGKTSKVEIVSGTADLLTKTGLAAGSATGVSGSNVNNILAVTFAEAKTIIELAVGANNVLVSSESLKTRVTSNTANDGVASSIQMGGTARTKFGFDAALHTGAAADADEYVLASYISTPSIAANASTQQIVSNRVDDTIEVRFTANNGNASIKVASEQVQV